MIWYVAVLCGLSCLAGALFAMWALKQFRRVSVEEDYHELQERVKTMEDMFKDRPCLLHRPDVRLKIVTSDDKPIDRPQGL